MACYVVGDLQGCYIELEELLEKIAYSPDTDRLYLVGDLVNRGPASLEVLRWVYRERHHASTVLGNHDLHLLACAAGVAQCKKGDTVSDILTAEDGPELIDWLRRQPLVIGLEDALIVHAGILPAWDEAQALLLAAEVSAVLAGEDCSWFLSNMYGNNPKSWDCGLARIDRLRLAVNVFTRMRMVDVAGGIDLKFKGELEKAPPNLLPWYAHPQRKLADRRIVCGHWSALGLHMAENVWAIDTGCVWGGKLTAVRLDDGEVFQVSARRCYQTFFD